jgi:hypothetical protein
MSNVITNLKVRFGADTSKFKKGMKDGDRAVQDFKKKGSSAFSQFAQAFGVNVDAITAQTQTFTAGLGAMKSGMTGAATGSGVLTKALKILKVALVSTGIGALIVALGSLMSYFTRTKEGSDLLKRAMDAIGAVFSVIVDRASALGKSIVEAFTKPKETVKNLWEFIKSQFVNRIAAVPKLIQAAWNIVKGIFDGTAKEAAADFAGAMTQLGTGLTPEQQKKVGDSIKGVAKEIKDEAAAAANLRKRMQELEDQEIRLIEVNAEREKQIESFRARSKELRDKDIEESRRALQQAMNIEQARLQDELRIARERAKIVEEQKALGNNLREDDRELAEAKAKVNELERQSLRMKRTMISEMNSLNREYERQQQAIRDTEMAMYDQIKAAGMMTATGTSVDTGSIDTMTLAPMPAIDTSLLEESAGQVRAIFDNLSEMINDTMTDLVIGFSESFGAMLAGSGSLADFGNFVMGTLADLAINVGKTAIATGVAVEGIKRALQSLNPVAAIAAGVALVALGTAVKSSLKSAASGSSSGATPSSAGSYGNTSSTVDVRGSTQRAEAKPITVNVTGSLKGQGRDLVAVIDTENQRKNVRT